MAKDPDDNPLRVLPWFWTQEYPAPDGAPIDEHQDTKDLEIIDVGETSQYFHPGPNTDPQEWRGGGKPFHREVGSLMDREVYYKAHTHLQVSGWGGVDDWEVDTQHQTGTAAVTFTEFDGP